MITEADIENGIENSRLRERTKEPRVFRPQDVSEHTKGRFHGAELARLGNPDRMFIEIAGIDTGGSTHIDVSNLIGKGIAAKSLNRIKDVLRLQKGELLDYLDISSATYSRRLRSRGNLSNAETDRIYRYTRLYTLATRMFHGNEDAALQWLKSPAYAFEDEIPLAHARTEFGAHEVETLIGRIQHGIPS